jgi:AcrR family transcriptional regulator
MNTMSSQKRRYELKARAERQQETRRRIVEATRALHEEVGPARTTVAEIARRASVQRLTVYNHFPQEQELFAACQGLHLSENPPPTFERALARRDPAARTRAALRELYAWYRQTEAMLSKVLRDRGAVPALDAQLRETSDARIAALADALAAGFTVRSARAARLRALLGVAVDFWTWQRLDREGLDDEAAARLMAEAAASLV